MAHGMLGMQALFYLVSRTLGLVWSDRFSNRIDDSMVFTVTV